jgi:hypothetical protein
MNVGHLVGRRRALLGLAVGLLGAWAGCSPTGGSASSADPKRAEEIKQKKLDSMKEIMERKQGGKRAP